MIYFLLGFVSAFLVCFGCLVGWWFLITRHRAMSRQQVDAEYQRIRRSVLASINSEHN